MRRKFSIVVSIELAENPTERDEQPDEWTAAGSVDREDVKAYVHEAVKTWGGQMPPDYPLFPTNITVKVR